MDALAGQGPVLFAGPMAEGEHGCIRVLLIADADNETAVTRLAVAGAAGSRTG
jgi:hypothetical protein